MPLPARPALSLLLLVASPTLLAAGLDEQKLAPGWECRVTSDRDDIWLKTLYKKQPQFDFRIGAGGSLAEIRQLKGKKPQALLATSPYGRLADQQVQWSLAAEKLVRKLPGVPASGWTYQVAQGLGYDNGYAPTVAVLVNEDGCQVDIYATPKEQYRPEQRGVWQGSFPNLTRYRVIGPGALAVRQVLRVSGAKADGKLTALENVRLQTSIPLIKPQFNQIGLGLDIHHQPKRSYRIGASFPAFADWSQDKSDPLLLAYDSKSLSERAALIVGSSSQPPCRQTASGCNDYGELRLNLFEATGTLTLLPATLLPTLNTGDMVDQSYLLYPAQGIGAAEHETLSWMQAQVPRPRVVPADQISSAKLGVIAAKLAFFEDAPGLRSNRLGRALNLNNVPEQLVQEAPALESSPPYRFSVVSSSQLLDIADASADDGTPALQAPYRAIAELHQRWSLLRDISGNFSIVNRDSGKCLEPENGAKVARTQIQQNTCHNGNSQKWSLRPTITGHWEIANAPSGLCLDAANGSREPGAPMQLWPCNGRDPQRWKIEEVDDNGKLNGKRFHPFTEGGFSGPRLSQGRNGNAWWVTSAALPPGYSAQSSWALALPRSPGARPLHECRRGDNNFVSNSVECEGATYNGITDWIYNAPLPGALPLYRCIDRDSKAYFLANSKLCEGQTLDQVLGFVLR